MQQLGLSGCSHFMHTLVLLSGRTTEDRTTNMVALGFRTCSDVVLADGTNRDRARFAVGCYYARWRQESTAYGMWSSVIDDGLCEYRTADRTARR